MQDLKEFSLILGLTHTEEKDFSVLFDDEDDIKYFTSEVLDIEKQKWEHLFDMRMYKLRNASISFEDFEVLYGEDPHISLVKLFRFDLNADDFALFQSIVKKNNLSPKDIFLLHKKDVHARAMKLAKMLP
ncbi:MULTISPECIES: hypothetical protein [Bacillus cereus group]|uniref:Uncharacterized protein n=1 Tax=Bacillus thuringiensis TaxID=1428 RepID=A0A9X7FXV9_BACTU|nr:MULTISPECIES: hypothetical protein [Bacillus cereus group]EKS7858261.1 hypothetical protein [Bacillus cereus]PEV64172.1 hypothetical protein CN434_25525 [Bacillus thuringiensis]PFT50802.1 hypothetical protein COK72_02005 [Bacillus thuringiensis]PFY22839.1 hypothetical protein COL44_18325 [Bacillus toyonensis]